MELAFTNRDLRDLCLSEALATERLGVKIAAKLKRRLADLAAAGNVEEVLSLPGKPTELEAHGKSCIAINLTNNYQLFFTSGHSETPCLVSGKTNWSLVRRIKILGVGQGL